MRQLQNSELSLATKVMSKLLAWRELRLDPEHTLGGIRADFMERQPLGWSASLDWGRFPPAAPVLQVTMMASGPHPGFDPTSLVALTGSPWPGA